MTTQELSMEIVEHIISYVPEYGISVNKFLHDVAMKSICSIYCCPRRLMIINNVSLDIGGIDYALFVSEDAIRGKSLVPIQLIENKTKVINTFMKRTRYLSEFTRLTDFPPWQLAASITKNYGIAKIINECLLSDDHYLYPLLQLIDDDGVIDMCMQSFKKYTPNDDIKEFVNNIRTSMILDKLGMTYEMKKTYNYYEIASVIIYGKDDKITYRWILERSHYKEELPDICLYIFTELHGYDCYSAFSWDLKEDDELLERLYNDLGSEKLSWDHVKEYPVVSYKEIMYEEVIEFEPLKTKSKKELLEIIKTMSKDISFLCNEIGDILAERRG